jgi:hypothetical protein
LFRCDFVEGGQDAGVSSAAIVHECAVDGLDAGDAGFVQRRCCGFGGRGLGLAGSIGGLNSFVGGMLLMEGCRMVEFGEGPVNVSGHGYVNVSVIVVPIESEAAVQRAGLALSRCSAVSRYPHSQKAVPWQNNSTVFLQRSLQRLTNNC